MNMIWEKNGYTKEVERRDGENWFLLRSPEGRVVKNCGCYPAFFGTRSSDGWEVVIHEP